MRLRILLFGVALVVTIGATFLFALTREPIGFLGALAGCLVAVVTHPREEA